MADENTKTYYLAADGMRFKGRRYRRGDKVELPAEQGDRLVETGSLVENEDDVPARDTSGAATAGLGDVANEASTLYAAQSVDEDGEVKESSFGHPDQVEKAEKERKEQADKGDATKPAASRRRASSSTSSGGGAATVAAGGEQKPRGSER